MIDVENIVFDSVYNAVSAAFPGIDASSVYEEVPKKMPHYSLSEINHTTESGTLAERELYVRVSFQSDSYTNTSMADCKAIDEAIYNKMLDIGFVCVSRQKMPNIDRTQFRITTRFTAVARIISDGDNQTVLFYNS